MKQFQYRFTVPEKKRVRMLISTDAKNEADDQFAIAHHLMTPKFDVRGIIPAHFETPFRSTGTSCQASLDESAPGSAKPKTGGAFMGAALFSACFAENGYY